MLESYILLGTLGIHTLEDLKRKQITVFITLFSAILGILCHLYYQNQSIYSMLSGLTSGVFILLFSVCSKGKIGMGDGAVMMLTGLYLGVEKNLCLMLFAFMLAGIWAGFGVLVLRYDKDRRIPFIPFLFAAYLLVLYLT